MRIVLGGILGGLALFVWGFVYWVVLGATLLPVPSMPDEGALVATMQANLPETGAYWIPAMPVHGPDIDDATKEQLDQDWMARHKAGPVAVVLYNVEGKDTEDPMMLVRGVVINAIAALLASILLFSACRGWGYAGRLTFLVGVGLVIAAGVHLVNWNFLYAPQDYTLYRIGDTVGGWFVAGIIIAAVVKRKARPEPTFI